MVRKGQPMCKVRCRDAHAGFGRKRGKWRALQWLLLGLMATAAAMLPSPKNVAAFEDDIHSDVTFAIALADSWTWEEAQTIAGADQAVDANEETKAWVRVKEYVLRRIPPIIGPLVWVPVFEPKPQNFRLHGFSRTDDTEASSNDDRNQDVKDNLADLENTMVNTAIDTVKTTGTQADRTKALIAVGVYLHDQADTWSHSGYGGTTFGHASDSLPVRDSPFYRTNPDHPALRPSKTRKALEETLAKLSTFQNRWKGTNTDITDADLDQLIRALTDERSLRLTDSQRKTCNKELTEHWLYLILKQKNKLSKVPEGYIEDFEAPTDQAFPDTPLMDWPSCKDIHDAVFTGSHEEKKVTEPARAIPRLDENGAPRQVNEDGTYKQVTSAIGFNYVPENALVQRTNTPDGCFYQASATASNLGPEPAPLAVLSFAVGSVDAFAPEGQLVEVGPLDVSQSVQLQANAVIPGTCPAESLFIMNVEPHPTFPLADTSWDDWDVSNDSIAGLLSPGGVTGVGGIAELPEITRTAASESGSPAGNSIALAALAAAALFAVGAGMWYARRLWIR